MNDYIRIRGYCPMGCGQTLAVWVLADGKSFIDCLAANCQRPRAVDELLADPETEHTVRLRVHDFNVKHPLRERLDGDLFDCPMLPVIAGADVPYPPTGLYRVRDNDGILEWELLSLARDREIIA